MQREAGGSGAVIVSLDWVLPVLIERQTEISLKGAAGTGEGGGVRAGCFGLFSAVYNLIWSDFGMLPRAGSSWRERVGASPLRCKQYTICRMPEWT